MAQWPEGRTQGQRVQRPECEKKLLFPSVLQQLLKSKKLQPFSHKRFVSGIAMLMAQWPEGGTQGQRAQRPECEISPFKVINTIKNI